MSNTIKTKSDQNLAPNEELEIYIRIKPYIGHCLSMNHELNNPLAVILGYTEVLSEECQNLSEDHKQYLNNIIKSAEKIQKYVTDLSEEKIALNENIDLKEVTAFYKNDKQNSD